MMRFVLYSNRKSLISRLIRWQTRGRYSHAALLLSSGEIIESMEGCGVRMRPSITDGLPEDDKYDIFKVPTTEEQNDKIFSFAVAQLGHKYDYLGVVRFLSRTSDYSSRGKWFCSELVFEAFKHVGIELFKHRHGWEISPAMLECSPLATKQITNNLR